MLAYTQAFISTSLRPEYSISSFAEDLLSLGAFPGLERGPSLELVTETLPKNVSTIFETTGPYAPPTFAVGHLYRLGLDTSAGVIPGVAAARPERGPPEFWL